MIAHAQRCAGADVLVRRIETRAAIRVAARGGWTGRWVAVGAALRGGGRTDARVAACRMNLAASARARWGPIPRPVFYATVVFAPEERAAVDLMRRVARRLLADLGLAEHAALILAWRAGTDARVEIVVNRVSPSAAAEIWTAWPEAGLIAASLRAQAADAERSDPARGWRAGRVEFAPRPPADAVSGPVTAGERLGPAVGSRRVSPWPGTGDDSFSLTLALDRVRQDQAVRRTEQKAAGRAVKGDAANGRAAKGRAAKARPGRGASGR